MSRQGRDACCWGSGVVQGDWVVRRLDSEISTTGTNRASEEASLRHSLGGSGATIGRFRRCARALPWLRRKRGGRGAEAHNAKGADSTFGSSVRLIGGVRDELGNWGDSSPMGQSNGPGRREGRSSQLQRFPRLLQTPQRERRPERPDEAPCSLHCSSRRRHVRAVLRTMTCKHASANKPTRPRAQRQLRESDDGAR